MGLPSFVWDYVVKAVGKWCSTHSHMGSATHPFVQTRDSGDVVLTLWKAPLSWRCGTASAMQRAFVTLCWDPLMDKRMGSVSARHLNCQTGDHIVIVITDEGAFRAKGAKGDTSLESSKKKSSSAIYCVFSRMKQLETAQIFDVK